MPYSSDPARTAIVLDLDDTLYFERDYVRSGIAAVGEWLAAKRDIHGFTEAATALFADGRREFLFDAALAMLGVEASPTLIARTVYEYRRHRPQITLAPDASDFLDRVADFSLALVTDGGALAQRMKVSALRLRERSIFPIVYTDDWGRSFWKPHLRAFSNVQALLAHCRRFIYVGDNPAKDFLAPRALGWTTIQIARPERLHRQPPSSHDHAADFSVASFAEFDEALLRDLGSEREQLRGR